MDLLLLHSRLLQSQSQPHIPLFPLLAFTGNVFVVSLAFADLVVAFYPYPLVLYAIFHDGWSLGETQCKVSHDCISNTNLVLKDFFNNIHASCLYCPSPFSSLL